MSHAQTRTHKINHNMDLGEATTFPLIVFFVPNHMACTQMSFCIEILKIETLMTLKAHNFMCRTSIKMRSEAKLYPSSRAFQWYVVCHLHLRKSRRFLTFSVRDSNWQFDSWPFFGHNLCFEYPNGSYEPILDIYVSKDFEWFKKLFNSMIFDPCNRLVKIQESMGTLIPKVGAHLGMCGFIPSHSPTLPGAWNVTLGLHSWPAHLQAFPLVMSLRLKLRQTLQDFELLILLPLACIIRFIIIIHIFVHS
jgi:hypothetical protein